MIKRNATADPSREWIIAGDRHNIESSFFIPTSVGCAAKLHSRY